MKKIALFSLAFIACLFSLSCRKSDRNNDKEVFSVMDNIMAVNFINDLYNQVMEGASLQTELNKVQSTCATYTVTAAAPDTVFPKTLTIDFGISNCVDANNVNHRGQIIAVFSNKYKVLNATIVITFLNYFYKDMEINGTFTITNKGLNAAGNKVFYITTTDATIYTQDKKSYVYYNCMFKKECIAGTGTPEITDDTFMLTGTASGINQLGNTFTSVIETALSVDNNCKHIVSGILKVTPKNLSVRKLNYGDGSCDGTMTFNINGATNNVVEE